jgi:hypothetical protein
LIETFALRRRLLHVFDQDEGAVTDRRDDLRRVVEFFRRIARVDVSQFRQEIDERREAVAHQPRRPLVFETPDDGHQRYRQFRHRPALRRTRRER